MILLRIFLYGIRLNKKNKKADFYNGIYDRYENPVLTREHIPLTWQYDLNEETILILWKDLESMQL